MHRTARKMALVAALALGTTAAAQAAALDGSNNGVVDPGELQRLVSSPAVSSTPIALNQWYTFAFGGVGSSFANGSGVELGTDPASIAAPDPAWTFTLPSAGGTLTVVDGFLSGDQFNVTDLGTSLGNTSAPTFGANCGNDITACLGDPVLSQGVFSLAAGTHAIDGTAIASPFGAGAAFFEVVPGAAPVPEPVSVALLGVGLLGLGLAGRRRRG